MNCTSRIPGVRRILALALLCGGLLCGVLMTACSSNRAPEPPQENPAASAPNAAAEITPDQVEVSDVKLLRGRDGKGYRVEAQVKNNSVQATLGEFEFQLVMQDCLPDGSCNILARDVTTIPAKLPPGKSAPFEYAPKLDDMPAAQGHLGYHYVVVAARSNSASGSTAKP
jgi:hypothetical protein